MTNETLILLRNILVTLHLDVTAPNFVQTAQSVANALVELDEILADGAK